MAEKGRQPPDQLALDGVDLGEGFQSPNCHLWQQRPKPAAPFSCWPEVNVYGRERQATPWPARPWRGWPGWRLPISQLSSLTTEAKASCTILLLIWNRFIASHPIIIPQTQKDPPEPIISPRTYNDPPEPIISPRTYNIPQTHNLQMTVLDLK
jgi:hypothetical protein